MLRALPRIRITFTVDENLPIRQVRSILTRHIVQVVDTGTKDPAILKAAETDGPIIVTADHWIYSQLRRVPHLDRREYQRAGVVRIPGTWAIAEPLLRTWLPVIETVHAMRSGEKDRRVVIELRENGAVYIDP